MKEDITLNGILKRLVSKGLIGLDSATEAQRSLNQHGFNLAAFLTTNELISPLRFAKESASEFGLPYLDIDKYEIIDIPEIVTHDTIERYLVACIGEKDDTLYIATSNPIQDDASSHHHEHCELS